MDKIKCHSPQKKVKGRVEKGTELGERRGERGGEPWSQPHLSWATSSTCPPPPAETTGLTSLSAGRAGVQQAQPCCCPQEPRVEAAPCFACTEICPPSPPLLRVMVQEGRDQPRAVGKKPSPAQKTHSRLKSDCAFFLPPHPGLRGRAAGVTMGCHRCGLRSPGRNPGDPASHRPDSLLPNAPLGLFPLLAVSFPRGERLCDRMTEDSNT